MQQTQVYNISGSVDSLIKASTLVAMQQVSTITLVVRFATRSDGQAGGIALLRSESTLRNAVADPQDGQRAERSFYEVHYIRRYVGKVTVLS